MSSRAHGGTRKGRSRSHAVRVVLLCAAIGAAVLFGSNVRAQGSEAAVPKDERRPSLSFGGTFSSNIARTSIDAYSGDVLCGVFTNGSGGRFSLQALYEQPLTETFSLVGGVSFRDLSSRFTTAPFNIEHALYPTTGSLITVNRQRVYDVTMNAYGPSGGIAFHPLDRITLNTRLAMYFVPKSTYAQSEQILTRGIVYEDNLLSTRPVAAGSLNAHPLFAALEFGAGYDLPLSERVAARPYAEALVGITSVANIAGSAYHAYAASGGISLVYTFPAAAIEAPRTEPVVTPPPPPVAKEAPLKPKPAPLRLAVRAVGLTDHDEEIPQPVVAIENVLVTDVSPTLGYVFFDDGSANVPSRYHRYNAPNDAAMFSTKDFYKLNAEGINHELLNIIGKRLLDHPKASITLTGTRSVRSSGDSASSDTIAFARAQQVAEYLQSVWQIAPSRIRIRARALPEMASDETTATGQAENRRVEITSSSREILDPIETRKLEQTATPPRIKFYQDIYSAHGVRSNKIVIRQGGRVIQTLDQLSGDSRSEWLWNLSEGDALKSNDSVYWTMQVTDSTGETAEVSGVIRIKPLEHTHAMHATDTTDADKLLERFHLLLFDYSSSSELGQNSDAVLSRLAAAVTPDAQITITGHTDITGDAAYNEKLSYQRASRASLLLGSKLRAMGKTIPDLELEARGARDLLFDNSVAEGRMLSRTVRVTIERDIK